MREGDEREHKYQAKPKGAANETSSVEAVERHRCLEVALQFIAPINDQPAATRLRVSGDRQKSKPTRWL